MIMKRQIIQFQGIVRNLPNDTVKDGSLLDTINLRYKDGALRPTGKKVEIGRWWNRNILCIHKIDENTICYIGRNFGFLQYYVYVDGVMASGPVTTSLQATEDMKFSAWNNALIVSERLNEALSLMIFDPASLQYRLYDGFGGASLTPDMPVVNFEREAYPTGDDTRNYNATLETLEEAQQAQWMKMYNDKSDAGYLSGCVLIRAAWELIDGTIIKQTIPIKLYACEISTTALTSSPYTVTTTFKAYKIKFMLCCNADWLEGIKEKYKDIVKSLVIYCTSPRAPELEVKTIKAGSYPLYDRRDNESTLVRRGNRTYDVQYLSEYIPNIEEELYYFLQSYSLDSLTANTWITMSFGSLLDLNTRRQMPINNLSHHTLYSDNVYIYNGRAWMGNIKVYLHKPAINGLIQPGDGYVTGDNYNVGIQFDIVIKENLVIKTWTGWSDNVNYYDTDGKIYFGIRYQKITTGSARRAAVRNDNSYWGYPDARARRAYIYIRYNNSVYLAKEVTLISLTGQNFAYNEGLLVQDYLYNMPDGSITYGNSDYYDTDRIQASELNNPFFWPAQNSYRLAGKIVGIASNTIALSTGQFGQYPLIVFTTVGIWALNMGLGEPLVTNIVPLSRDICSDPDTITPVDGGIVFLTDAGLMMLAGSKIIDIGNAADGPHELPLEDWQKRQLARHLVTGSPYAMNPIPPEAETEWDDAHNILTITLAGNKYYYYFDDKTSLWYNVTVTPFYSCCNESFLNYIKGDGVAIVWESVNKELIISKRDATYSWVYNATSGTWTKISESWAVFRSIYPSAYGVKLTGGAEPNKQFGILYNYYAVADPRNIAAEGWHVMTYAELADLVATAGGESVAGGKLKDNSGLYWSSPGTNDFGFSARGAGYRENIFFGLLNMNYIATSTEDGAGYHVLMLYTLDNCYLTIIPKYWGTSVRLVKDSTTLGYGERGVYTGNDGKEYETICIYGKEYLAENLCETKYRNGDIIPEVTDQDAWTALTTGALCAYNNDLSYLGRWAPYTEIVYDLRQTQYSYPYISLLITRPLKITDANIKKINRIALMADIKSPEGYLMMALLGSVNGKAWNILEVLSVPNDKIDGRPPMLHRQHSSYRHYMLIVGIKMGEGSAISHCLVDAEDRFNNLLR